MKGEEVERVLEGVRQALLSYTGGHFCRRCRREMPSQPTGICLRAATFQDDDPNGVWTVTWRATEEGWGFVEVGTDRYWICPLCVSELLPLAQKR